MGPHIHWVHGGVHGGVTSFPDWVYRSHAGVTEGRIQYATLPEPKSPTVYQAKAASDLKPVECWKPKETFGPPPVILGALNGSFHMYESHQQYAFKNQNTFLSHCRAQKALVLCCKPTPCHLGCRLWFAFVALKNIARPVKANAKSKKKKTQTNLIVVSSVTERRRKANTNICKTHVWIRTSLAFSH